MKYIFMDTMAFLHYRLFTQIDFLSLFGSEPTTIVILEVVCHEIDNHKNQNPRKKIRARASNVTSKILEALKGESNALLRDNLRVEFCPRCTIDFAAMGLDASSNDHRIIGAIIDFSNKIDKEKDSILFITHDIASTLTAQSRGILVKTLPDELKLAEEPDEDEKELQQLRRENAELKSASPRLALMVNGCKDNVVNISTEDFRFFRTPEYTPLDDIIKAFPSVELKECLPQNATIAQLAALNLTLGDGKTDIVRENEDISRYNRDRERYIKAYEQYVHAIKAREKNILVELRLCIENTGTKPAEGVDIYLHFPDGFRMFAEDDFPQALHPPDEPRKPRTSGELLADKMRISLPNFHLPDYTSKLSPAMPKSFSLKKTHSYEFEEYANMIKHGSHAAYHLPKLFLWYKDASEIKTFSMEYRLCANNIPTTISGEVIFKFDIAELTEKSSAQDNKS